MDVEDVNDGPPGVPRFKSELKSQPQNTPEFGESSYISRREKNYSNMGNLARRVDQGEKRLRDRVGRFRNFMKDKNNRLRDYMSENPDKLQTALNVVLVIAVILLVASNFVEGHGFFRAGVTASIIGIFVKLYFDNRPLANKTLVGLGALTASVLSIIGNVII